MDDRVHLLGIRHHGPGSALLLRRALDVIDPTCVLIEGPEEANELIRFAAGGSLKPPLAILLYATDDPKSGVFMPFAEFSPEWQAILWAVARSRRVEFIDWPAGVALAFSEQTDSDPTKLERTADPLDEIAAAAGYGDGEAFWNALVEQSGGMGQQALSIFSAIETMMTETRAAETEAAEANDSARQAYREAFMRMNIRRALKTCDGQIAVVCGAWHVSALRQPRTLAEDRVVVKDLKRVKVEATWVPWTDSRLSVRSGYGAGVISPGWYRHLWSLYAEREIPGIDKFAASWQAKAAALLRSEGYAAPTASAIEAARLALSLSAMRGVAVPGLVEMRDASLATLCHGDEIPMLLIERKLYVGESVGEIGEDVPQMPLARDLAAWQRRTRLRPEDAETEVRLDLRSEAGLLKSTLLHRLNLIDVRWGKLIDAEAGRGTFRELWILRWVPELSVALAEALIHGITIDQAAANATIAKAKDASSVAVLTDLVRGALVADLPDAASACIALLQAAAVHASDITDLMQAVVPLIHVLRYGSARKIPEDALRGLIRSLCVEVNAGVRTGSHALDEETAAARTKAMRDYDHVLGLFGDEELGSTWRTELGRVVDDPQVAPAVAGVGLRVLLESKVREARDIAAAFSLHMSGREPQKSGAFLEGFLSGGSEVMLHDDQLLGLIDEWMCILGEEDFVEALPLLRRSFSEFDGVSRRRLVEKIKQDRRTSGTDTRVTTEDNPAFAQALPLLFQILGMGTGGDS